jgi:hypothetical protein
LYAIAGPEILAGMWTSNFESNAIAALQDFIAVTSKTSVILVQILAHRLGFQSRNVGEPLGRTGQRLPVR